jgi:predicted choloylglycine hydrolase
MDYNSKYKSSQIEALLDLVASGNTGGGSGGSGAYSEVNHGTSDTTFTLTPNTFHIWEEVSALTLTLGSETAGVANEYLFQFTSGATATSLTLPDDIKWANDAAPVIAENMIYQVSILKGLASVLEFSNSSLIFFTTTANAAHGTLQAEKGMTWEEWVNSEYNTVNGRISGSQVFLGAWLVSGQTPSDIIAETQYTVVYWD